VATTEHNALLPAVVLHVSCPAGGPRGGVIFDASGNL
jgi:hypothetical protein